MNLGNRHNPNTRLTLISSYKTKVSYNSLYADEPLSWRDIEIQLYFVEGFDEINIYKKDCKSVDRSEYLNTDDILWEMGWLETRDDIYKHSNMDHYFKSVIRDLKLREVCT